MMKNNLNIRLGFALALLTLACTAAAQGLSGQMTPTHSLYTREGDEVAIAVDFDLGKSKVRANDFYLVTPQLVSNVDANKVCQLPPFMVAGKTRATILERNERYGNQPDYMVAKPHIVVRNNGLAQIYNYSAQVPFEPWMMDAHLELIEWASGCAACDKGMTTTQLAERILREPNFQLAYVSPKVEELKVRSDRYTATIGFPVNSDVIKAPFGNNKEVLSEVDAKVVEILNNKDLNTSKIEIVGFASPEASAAYNKRLAEKRAAAFAGYLSSRYAVDARHFTSQGYGEDWNRAEELIRENSIGLADATRQQVLDIIQSTPDVDARDAKIKAIDGGVTYKRLLTEVWPKIRRTEYTISYSVRPFNVEEAKQLIKTNPKLLSLNEMYLVAKSYDPSSEEYKQVFDIASRLYPNEPEALINSAAAELEVGSYARALKVLPSLGNRPEALNNLGVATALSGNREQARTLLERAASLGSAEAKHNLSELGF